jgi:Flp pilus assembly protein TadD
MPGDRRGIILMSALRLLCRYRHNKRTLEARDLLLPAASQFKKNGLIRYNLACYECQLGNLPEAKRWLAEAFALHNSKQTKLDALNDPDLEPLWQHIGEL